MKTISLSTLLLSLALVFTACNKEVEAPAPHEVQTLTTVAISDAESLYLVGSPTSKSDAEQKKLYKITAQGQDQLVAFSDPKGDSINFNVVNVWRISSSYLLVAGSIIPIGGDPYGSYQPHYWLVRRSDNAVFDLKEHGDMIADNIKSFTLLTDNDDNIYWEDRGLYKMTIPKTGDITAVSVSGDLGGITSCGIDVNYTILMGIYSFSNSTTEVWCRFPDGSFAKSDDKEFLGKGNSIGHLFAIKAKGTGGFIVLKDIDHNYGRTEVIKVTPNIATKKLDYEQLSTIDKDLNACTKREDLLDGSSMLYSEDYREYIFINANGTVETKSYPGFPYQNKVISNNCVYGTDGSAVYVMNFDTRETKQIFSDNRYRIDSYQVSPKNDYLDIYGLRYADARKVLLRVDASGQIIKETLQTDNNAEIITFIRLN